jgi:hypothetical protein
MVKGGIMAKSITYGIGGYDPTKPNDNIVEEIDLPEEQE